MSNPANYIKKWHQVILEGKMELLDNLLNDNATFYSPVVFTPLEGKEITKMYLSAAGVSFNMDSFKYTREINDGNHSILEFDIVAHYPQTKHKFRTNRRPASELLSQKVKDQIYKNCRIEFDARGYER